MGFGENLSLTRHVFENVYAVIIVLHPLELVVLVSVRGLRARKIESLQLT